MVYQAILMAPPTTTAVNIHGYFNYLMYQQQLNHSLQREGVRKHAAFAEKPRIRGGLQDRRL
jgi:hypothetical protein